MGISSVSASERINAIVGEFLKGAENIEHNRDLQELGLTSMQMVNLMLTIEAEFDLTIPSSKLVPANFRTVQIIEALVLDLTH